MSLHDRRNHTSACLKFIDHDGKLVGGSGEIHIDDDSFSSIANRSISIPLSLDMTTVKGAREKPAREKKNREGKNCA